MLGDHPSSEGAIFAKRAGNPFALSSLVSRVILPALSGWRERYEEYGRLLPPDLPRYGSQQHFPYVLNEATHRKRMLDAGRTDRWQYA